MEDCTLHPSMKSVMLAYMLAVIVVLASDWGIYQYFDSHPDKAYPPTWVYLIPLIVLLPPLNMQLKRRMVTLKIHDDHLTLESGFLSRTRRTVDMGKIQDVTVRQSFGQRLMNTGDIVLESAGESGAMGIQNLDNPRAIADGILSTSKKSQRTI
jgi:membrane protein YdbS with pleckstrin-like domain